MTDALESLLKEFEPVFFTGGAPGHYGENPACYPIEEKIVAELLSWRDEDIIAMVDSIEPGSRMEDMLFSALVGVGDSTRTVLSDPGRCNLDPHVDQNTGKVVWYR